MRLVSLFLFLGLAVGASAQDSDGDGVPNALEASGFRFDIGSGAPVACDPAIELPCYVTDPLTWSSDGDPYSDLQEASGVNMDATVEAPYNSPLVAAYPVIEVTLGSYTFTSNATITDARGAALTEGMSFSRNVEETASASVTVGSEYNVVTGPTISGEATAGYSYTESYGSEVTSGRELNWETATSTELDNAGTLSLALFARNTGGATALAIRPTFNITIGGELVATVVPDEPLALSLAPGESGVPVVPIVGGEPLAIQLTLERLLALERGAAVAIRVVGIEANIQRWRPGDSNWACGSGETCTWTSFENQIRPRTTRLIVDFGYSGDPEATIPAPFRGNPFDFRVYAGSPSVSANLTLEAMLEIIGFDVTGAGAIEGRPYASWILFEQPDGDGLRPVYEAWQAVGGPPSMLDVVIPREATLALSSPDPASPGAAIRAVAATVDLLHVRAAIAARGGIPVESARAVLFQDGVARTVPLSPVFGRAYWSTEGAAFPTSPIGMASSYIEVTDVSGAVRRSPLELPIEQASTCGEVRDEDLFDVYNGGGRTVIFPTGILDGPVEVHCEVGSDETRYWVPQSVNARPLPLVDAVLLDDGTAIAVAEPPGDRSFVIYRSADGGRTWTRDTSVRASTMRGIAVRPDTQTLIATGVDIEGGGDYIRSEDGGATWEARSGPSDLAWVSHGGGGTWFAASGSAVYRSTDDGRTFTALTLPEAPERIVDVAFRSATIGMYVDTGNGASGSGHVWRTRDGGATWTEAVRAHNTVAVAYGGDGTWFVTGGRREVSGDDRVLRLTGDGDTWDNIPLSPLGAENLGRAAFVTPEIGYIPSEAGILKTEDGGSTWSFEPAVPQTRPRFVLPFDARRAVVLGSDFRASGTGAGLVQVTTSGGTGTVVATAQDPSPTASTALDPASPNPVRDRTTLTYRLDAPGDVELVVFDLLGREVARLADGPQRAGEHGVTWMPQGLASGVYVARLRVGDAVSSRTLTVVR
ncbi:hypothetical protein B1759_15465 [Rubrivirga sp. SAORIC476]|uniref:binary toxin-like calcium binding domain-containing protein n=1 Tax=Rubrivirga sp. SAORIC476 TaxID=1961794 RepID=UPI000BC9E36B|nr:binary toxin-like calcium binding domain-containing protein [Rubrivirga sp. SAORIC476]PAP79710.1 hypothetical protein B1759_15465 [Rubrivirga sp. SAORIC476]